MYKKCRGEIDLYNRFCKRFFAAVIVRLTAQADSRALRKKVDEKSCVTFLLCDPGWYVQRS